tara:strand:+ start:1686 stop:2882 length:1197 start_codon:yes stop_codon:yes gene_type:complete
MNNKFKTSIVILNGFLGSGKTTLFRNLLTQSKKKAISVCAIVNDMSDLDVDGELIASSDFIENNNNLESIHSCVLSSKKGIKKLEEALNKLCLNQNPKMIIIETSGSCHPMPLVEYFKNNEQFNLKKVYTLVDSLMLSHDFNYGKNLIPQMQINITNYKRDIVNLLVEQIMFSSDLILTKTDRIKKENISHIVQQIQDINPYTSINSISFGNLPIEYLLDSDFYDYDKVNGLIEELKPILEFESQVEKPYNLATRVIKDDRPFHPKRLWDVCHQYLDQRIYRSKGFFWLASRKKDSLLWNQAAAGINLELIGIWLSWIIEDNNGNLLDSEIKLIKEKLSKESGRFGDRHCELTVIGDKTQVDKFTDALKSCFLNDKEIALWKNDYIFEDPWPKNIVKR